MEKRCGRCKEVKPVENFYRRKRSKDGLQVHCKRCQSAVGREPGKRTRINRNHHLRSQYGFGIADFERLVAERQGRCDCCGRLPVKLLRVDHDHSTGIFRGLVCAACNAGLGLLGDNADGLEKALAYLRKAR